METPDTDFDFGENVDHDGDMEAALEAAAPPVSPRSFASIPSYEPISGGNASKRGPGVASQDLTIVKPTALFNQDIAVIGYSIMDSKFEANQEYAMVEFVDASDQIMAFFTTSKILIETLDARHLAKQIPFRTQIREVKNEKSGRSFHQFA